MGKVLAMTATSVLLATVFLIPGSWSTMSIDTGEQRIAESPVSQNLVDIEVLFVPAVPFLQMPSIDLMVGNGMVHGLFLASNRLVTTTVAMGFFKWVPPGWIALDLVCTHIVVTVVDWEGSMVDHHEVTGPSGFLFSNNWYGTATLDRPRLSTGPFFFVFIEIYGNYE